MADKNDEQLYVGGGTKVFPKLGGNAVTTDKIADGAVTEAKLATGAVTNGALSANAVTADKLNSGAVTNAKLAPGAVTGDKVANNSLVTSNFMDLAVTTAKLNSGAVTKDKIALGAITDAKIADYAIHFRHLGLPCFISRTEETLQDAAHRLCDAYIGEGNPPQDNYLFRITMLPSTDGIDFSYTRTTISDGTVTSYTKWLSFGLLFFTSDFSIVRFTGLTVDQGIIFNTINSTSYRYVFTIHNFMACPLIAYGTPTRVVDITSSNAKAAAFSAEDEDDYDAGLANE